MKRKLLLSGLLVASAFVVVGGLGGGQARTLDLRESKTVSALQEQYKGVDSDDIRFDKWTPLPLPTKIPSAEERQLELSRIEQGSAAIERDKNQVAAAVADGERTIKTVETDFSNGRLSRKDTDMLVNLFREKVDKYKRTAEESQQRLGKLEARKQELLTFKEPDHIVYTQVEIDLGMMTHKKTVFYNITQQRPLTEEEIGQHPMATEWKVKYPTSLSLKVNENVMVAGGFSVFFLILAYIWETAEYWSRDAYPEQNYQIRIYL